MTKHIARSDTAIIIVVVFGKTPLPAVDVHSPSSYEQQTYGPISFQIAVAPARSLEPEFDVLGMSFLGKTVVMDFRPSNNLVADENNPGSGAPTIIETAMQTYVYDAETPYNPAALDTDPGVVPSEHLRPLGGGGASEGRNRNE